MHTFIQSPSFPATLTSAVFVEYQTLKRPQEEEKKKDSAFKTKLLKDRIYARQFVCCKTCSAPRGAETNSGNWMYETGCSRQRRRRRQRRRAGKSMRATACSSSLSPPLQCHVTHDAD